MPDQIWPHFDPGSAGVSLVIWPKKSTTFVTVEFDVLQAMKKLVVIFCHSFSASQLFKCTWPGCSYRVNRRSRLDEHMDMHRASLPLRVAHQV